MKQKQFKIMEVIINMYDDYYVAYDNEYYNYWRIQEFEKKYLCLMNTKALNNNLLYILFGTIK